MQPTPRPRRCANGAASAYGSGWHLATGAMLLLLALLTLGIGCATRVNQSIENEARDRTGRFDGPWVVHRLPAARTQIRGRERYACPTEGFDFPVSVRDGVIRVELDGRTHEANVAEDGRFRLVIPTGAEYRRHSGANENNSQITVVLQGSLAEGDRSGLYTLGSARLNNQGCEARARFEPLRRETFGGS